MAEFVLENNFLKINSKAMQQVSSIVIGSKLTPPYACISMDSMEIQFLEVEFFKPWDW